MQEHVCHVAVQWPLAVILVSFVSEVGYGLLQGANAATPKSNRKRSKASISAVINACGAKDITNSLVLKRQQVIQDVNMMLTLH